MADSKDIKRLTEYRCQINNSVVESIQESVKKLNEAMSMIADLQSINEALTLALAESDKEKQNQANELEVLRRNIESMKEAVRGTAEKEKQYEALELSMAKVTALLAGLEEREKQLAASEQKLVQEKQLFESERDSIIASKTDAEQKAGCYQEEKNDAIKSRDSAIAKRDAAIAERDTAIREKKEAERKKAEAERDLAEARKKLVEYCKASEQDEVQLTQITKLKEWYRNYAIAIDRKIVDYFRGKIGDLSNHYCTYLNNPDKLDEIHVHFPNYRIEEEPKNNSDNEKEETGPGDSGQDGGNSGSVKTDEKEDKQVKKDKKEKKSGESGQSRLDELKKHKEKNNA